MYSVDTAIQQYSVNGYRVSLYADGLWRTSHHITLEEARKSVRSMLSRFEGKIGC